CHKHGSVDLRGVRVAARLGNARSDLIDEDGLTRTDLLLQTLRRDCLLMPHQPVPALLLDLVRDRGAERIRGRALDRLVAEAADAIELGFGEPVEQQCKIFLGLARKTYDEARAQGEIGADLTPAPDPH